MSTVIRNVIKRIRDDSKVFLSSSQPMDYFLTCALAMIPLLLDSLFYDSELSCPQENHLFYSVFMLISPTISVVMMAGILGLQYIHKNFSKIPFKQILKRMVASIWSVFFICGITLGSAFIKGDPYACIAVGPPPFPYDSVVLAEYRFSHYNYVVKSKLYGWGIIWGAMIYIMIGILIRFTVAKPIKIETLFKNFHLIRNEETKELVNNEIVSLGKAVAKERVDRCLKIAEELFHYGPLATLVFLDKFRRNETRLSKEDKLLLCSDKFCKLDENIDSAMNSLQKKITNPYNLKDDPEESQHIRLLD